MLKSSNKKNKDNRISPKTQAFDQKETVNLSK